MVRKAEGPRPFPDLLGLRAGVRAQAVVDGRNRNVWSPRSGHCARSSISATESGPPKPPAADEDGPTAARARRPRRSCPGCVGPRSASALQLFAFALGRLADAGRGARKFHADFVEGRAGLVPGANGAERLAKPQQGVRRLRRLAEFLRDLQIFLRRLAMASAQEETLAEVEGRGRRIFALGVLGQETLERFLGRLEFSGFQRRDGPFIFLFGTGRRGDGGRRDLGRRRRG